MFGMAKLEWCGYATVNKFLKIFLFVLTECTNVTDRHTYRQTDTAWWHRPRLHIIARQWWTNSATHCTGFSQL